MPRTGSRRSMAVRMGRRVVLGVALALAGAAGGGMRAEVDEAPAPEVRLGGLHVPGFRTERLEPERFRALHAAVAPRGERWTQIPWEPDLTRARERATREGKPLLMWIMDGHPLGCT